MFYPISLVFQIKCWFKGQIISIIHLSLPNAYKLMCFDRDINGNRDVKFLEYDLLFVQRCVKLTLVKRGQNYVHVVIEWPPFLSLGKSVKYRSLAFSVVWLLVWPNRHYLCPFLWENSWSNTFLTEFAKLIHSILKSYLIFYAPAISQDILLYFNLLKTKITW